jgi:hypothetical protein
MRTFTPRAEAPTIRVADIAYLRFARRDLARAERYFIDFGLKISARTENAIYFRGVLPQHHCVMLEARRHDTFVALGLRAASALICMPPRRIPPRSSGRRAEAAKSCDCPTRPAFASKSFTGWRTCPGCLRGRRAWRTFRSRSLARTRRSPRSSDRPRCSALGMR